VQGGARTWVPREGRWLDVGRRGDMGRDEVLLGTRNPHWGCNCGRAGANENWACRIKCRGCGRPAPEGISRKAKAEDAKAREAKKDADKGKGGGRPAGGGGGDKVTALERELRELKARVKEQDEELAEAKAHGAGGDDAMGVGDDPLGEAVGKARAALKAVKDVPEAGRAYLAGGYEKCLAERQADLDKALAARRASNPLDKQLESAEAYKARRLKKVEEEKELLAERQAEADEAAARLEEQKKELADAQKKAAEAAAEVAELAARYAAERNAAAPHPLPAAATAEASDTVSRAFAEQKWQEREAEFAQQLEQVSALLQAAQDGAGGTASVASESVAGDLGSLDDLADDEKWTKVEGAKRKAILSREAGRKKVELANSIKAKLGKHHKVMSPFGKK